MFGDIGYNAVKLVHVFSQAHSGLLTAPSVDRHSVGLASAQNLDPWCGHKCSVWLVRTNEYPDLILNVKMVGQAGR